MPLVQGLVVCTLWPLTFVEDMDTDTMSTISVHDIVDRFLEGRPPSLPYKVTRKKPEQDGGVH